MGTSGRRALVVGQGQDADAAAAILARRGVGVTRAENPDAVADTPFADIMVVDEWTAEIAPHVVRAQEAGTVITVPAELILRVLDRPVVAVTGSAGKTTTSRLIAAILRADGRRVAVADARAGNAWPNHTLLDGRADGADVVVAELTSTHLCHMASWEGASLAVLTALWPDHIELHGSREAYEAAKCRLLDRADRVVAGVDDDVVARLGGAWNVDAEFSRRGPVPRGAWIDGRDLLVADGGGPPVRAMTVDAAPPGVHPGSLVAAAAAGVALGVAGETVGQGIVAAGGMPHRMARIGAWEDRELVDDSVCATPRKFVEALARCPRGHTVAVIGGDLVVGGCEVHGSPDERAALAAAAEAVQEAAREVIAFGPAAAVVGDLGVRAVVAPDLAAAVARARELSRAGDTILVSPMFPVSQDERDAVPRLLRGERL